MQNFDQVEVTYYYFLKFSFNTSNISIYLEFKSQEKREEMQDYYSNLKSYPNKNKIFYHLNNPPHISDLLYKLIT